MRTAISVAIAGAALAAANPQNIDPNSIAAELPSLVGELGPLVTAEASQLIPVLESLSIPGVAPTVAISQLPAILNSELPPLETAAFNLIPSGVFPPDVLSVIESEAPPIFTALASNIDGLLAQLPATLQTQGVSALGPFLASNLPAVESALLADVSSLIPEASSILTALGGLGGGVVSTGFPAPTPTATGFSGALTPSAPVATFTGAANSNGWGKEVVGAAAIAGVVGAML